MLDSFRDEPAINEIEKKKYTDVVFVKNSSMIKLEWSSIKIYCKRIQLESSFWDENCVSSPFGLCEFYSPYLHCLDEYLHLWDMEPLVIMTDFYCLLMAIRLLVSYVTS